MCIRDRLVLAVSPVRDAQDRQLAQPVGQRRAEHQMVVEAQERPGELGVTHERREQIARRFRIAALRRQHARQRVIDSVVPLVRGERGHTRTGWFLSFTRIRFSYFANRFPPFQQMVNPTVQMCRSVTCHLSSNDAAWGPYEGFRTLILAAREDSFLR